MNGWDVSWKHDHCWRRYRIGENDSQTSLGSCTWLDKIILNHYLWRPDFGQNVYQPSSGKKYCMGQMRSSTCSWIGCYKTTIGEGVCLDRMLSHPSCRQVSWIKLIPKRKLRCHTQPSHVEVSCWKGCCLTNTWWSCLIGEDGIVITAESCLIGQFDPIFSLVGVFP